MQHDIMTGPKSVDGGMRGYFVDQIVLGCAFLSDLVHHTE